MASSLSPRQLFSQGRSHLLTQRGIQAALEREVSEKRKDLFRSRSGAWGSKDGMDLPDPISMTDTPQGTPIVIVGS